MTLKLGMKHQGMKLYKVYVNHDPGMTLTYFMARSTQVAYPIFQASVYRTRALVLWLIFFFCSFEISEGILRNQKIMIGLDSFSSQL